MSHAKAFALVPLPPTLKPAPRALTGGDRIQEIPITEIHFPVS